LRNKTIKVTAVSKESAQKTPLRLEAENESNIKLTQLQQTQLSKQSLLQAKKGTICHWFNCKGKPSVPNAFSTLLVK